MRFLWFSIFAFFLASFSRAETYVIGAQDIQYYPHYDFSSPVDKGLAWAILQRYSQQSGHTFIYMKMPVLRLQRELVKGNVDLIYPDNPKWYNQVIPSEQKIYSAPLTRALGGTIIKVKDRNKGIERVRRLAIPLGFTPVNWQSRVDKRLTRLVEVADIVTALQLLQIDRVDAANLEYNVTQHLARSTPELGPFTLDPTLPHDNVAFMLATLKHPELIEDINRFLAAHKPEIEALKARYGVEDPDITLAELKKFIR